MVYSVEEAKALLRRTLPVARRVLGENDETTLRMRWNCALALYDDPTATLTDLREAVATHEDAGRISRRVLGGEHPLTMTFESALRESRAVLRARKAPVQEKLAQDAFRTAQVKLAQECSEIAKTLADTTLGEETPPERA